MAATVQQVADMIGGRDGQDAGDRCSPMQLAGEILDAVQGDALRPVEVPGAEAARSEWTDGEEVGPII